MTESGRLSDEARGPRIAPVGPAATHDEIRVFVQARLSLFARVMFWIFWILLGLVVGLYEIWPEVRPARVEVYFGFAIAMLIVSSAVWVVAVRRPGASIRTLYAIDAIYLFMAGATFGVSAYFQSDLELSIYASMISHLMTLFARAIIVPSSGARTAAVSTLSLVPLFVGALGVTAVMPERIGLPPVAFTIASVFYSAAAILIATTGSHIIYGLRRQVRAVMQLGQYTLVERIPGGGMGEVYRARHLLLRRPTAIKLLPPDKVGAESLRRFEREVQNTSLLTHPNTVAIYDYGRSPDGVFYYAMEYLDGVNLEELVRLDGPQPASRVVHILVQVCGALDEAHAAGLIHRDIKPANVILCQRGRMPDVAKVVDFGLVKEVDSSNEDSTARVVLGTPAYISPEAVTDPDHIGPASDLYSLGATAYFLLTGHHVVEGKTAVEMCVRHVRDVPVPPSRRTENPIPAELEELVMACLRKDPAARPRSAFDLRIALTHLQSYREWDETTARAWWHRFHAMDLAASDGSASSEVRRVAQTVTIDVIARTVPIDDGKTSDDLGDVGAISAGPAGRA